MALRNKFLLPTCAPDLVDIDTYFFSKKIFRSDTRICVTITSFFELFLSPVVQSTRARLIETPPTKYCGSAAVVRRGGRMGDIWGAAPRLEARSSSRTAAPRCFCPELGTDLPTIVVEMHSTEIVENSPRFLPVAHPGALCVGRRSI